MFLPIYKQMKKEKGQGFGYCVIYANPHILPRGPKTSPGIIVCQ